MMSRRSRLSITSLALIVALTLPVVGLVPEFVHLAPDLNDGAFHLGAIRETIAALQAGDNPLDFWMPTWLSGFPLFHYYHFGPHFALALIDRVLGGAVALPLLYRSAILCALALFPLANYAALRLLGRNRTTAIAAALLSFSIAGNARYGIELESFTWYGWGLFTQALALPLLPLALAFGWRAMEGQSRTITAAAVLVVALLSHVLYGYIAGLSLALAALLAPTLPALWQRLQRNAALFAQFLLLAGFFLLPLYASRAYHAVSLYDSAEKFDSYGATAVLAWLLGGSFLDHGRLPVLTVLAAAGLYISAKEWLERRDRVHGWIVLAFAFWTLLYFGRPTWGAWIDWLPMSRGLHLERLSSAVHLFALWSAAVAVSAILQWCRDGSRSRWGRAAVLVGLVGALASVALERGRYLERNASAVASTARQYAAAGASFEPVLEFLRSHPGRVYAGRRGNWGQSYTVAGIPVYHLLSAQAVETIGHAPFSWALSTDFQMQIGALDARLIRLYDIAYLVAPESVAPPQDAALVLTSGPHRVYRLRNEGPFGLVRVPLTISGTFETTWAMTQSWDKGLWSRRAAHAELRLAGESGADVRMVDAYRFATTAEPEVQHVFDPPGLFMSEPAAPPRGRLVGSRGSRGEAEVRVELDEDGVVLFRSTYHPNWRATLDGVPVSTMLLTPGFVGVAVPAGSHHLRLEYAPGWSKLGLLILGIGLALALELALRRRIGGRGRNSDNSADRRESFGSLLAPAGGAAGGGIPGRQLVVGLALAIGVLAVHVALMPSRGWERDLYWFATWLRAGAEHGAAYVGQHVWCDYPPLYLYLLQALGWLWHAWSGLPWPDDGTAMSQILLKLPASIGTIVTGLVLARLALASAGVSMAAVVGLAYALNPALVFNGAVWGQVDALLALLALAAVLYTAQGRIAVGFAWLAAALLFKQQAIVVVPVLVVAAYHAGGASGLLAAARGALLAGLVVLAPYYAAGTTESLITTLLTVTDRYPFVSMNAHNVWWLVFGPSSLATSDLTSVGQGLLTYRAVGLIGFGMATGMILWRLWHRLSQDRSDRLVALAEACALQFLAFYLLPTQMHERYVLPALVFVAVLCIRDRRVWWIYGGLSLAIAVSLASTLATAYPQPLGPLAWLLWPNRAETYAAAAIIGVGSVLLFGRGLALANLRMAAAVLPGGIALVVALAAVPVADAVRLCEQGMVRATQGWGTPQRHKSVAGNRLSIAGFVFRHGIGAHAPSRLTFQLGGRFRTFETGFGVDDAANVSQRIQVRLWADDELRYDSGAQRAGGFPRRVQVPVEGAEFLTLEVLDGGDGRDRDHLNWVEPVLRR